MNLDSVYIGFLYYIIFAMVFAYTFVNSKQANRLLNLWVDLESPYSESMKNYDRRNNPKPLGCSLTFSNKVYYKLMTYTVLGTSIAAFITFCVQLVYIIATNTKLLTIDYLWSIIIIMVAVLSNIFIETLKTSIQCDISVMQYNMHLSNKHQIG